MISVDSGMGMNWLIGCLREERYTERWVKLWKENMIFKEVKRELYEKVVIPTVVYVRGCGI